MLHNYWVDRRRDRTRHTKFIADIIMTWSIS